MQSEAIMLLQLSCGARQGQGRAERKSAVVSTYMLGWYRRRFERGAQGELKASLHLARELHIGTDVEEGGRVRSAARAQLKLIGELLRDDEGGN